MEQNLSKKTRTESDLIGSREVPESALYGVQTLRGIENFRISKFHLNEYPLFIQALAITKMGAAIANPTPPITPSPIPPRRAPIIMAVRTNANCNIIGCCFKFETKISDFSLCIFFFLY